MGLVENNVGFFFHSLQTTLHCSVSQSSGLYFTTLFSSLKGWPCLLLKNKNKNRKYPGLNSPTSRTNYAPNPGNSSYQLDNYFLVSKRRQLHPGISHQSITISIPNSVVVHFLHWLIPLSRWTSSQSGHSATPCASWCLSTVVTILSFLTLKSFSPAMIVSQL